MSYYSYLKAAKRSVLLKKHLEYLQSKEWAIIREKVLERDDYTCVLCGATDCQLDVHHKTYKRHGNEKLFDLITLCENCHNEIHQL